MRANPDFDTHYPFTLKQVGEQWAVWNIRDDITLPERYDTSKECWAAVQEAKRLEG
jgi:hypothetical protein